LHLHRDEVVVTFQTCFAHDRYFQAGDGRFQLPRQIEAALLRSLVRVDARSGIYLRIFFSNPQEIVKRLQVK
jgi:hypothetical protein